mmetsp:Transcript_18859/g.38699  ORF Transcript_18859/g.38699 Transcript_18859/m.38699 type:complete len:155 (-) Transcript_18859:1188-1652(-)
MDGREKIECVIYCDDKKGGRETLSRDDPQRQPMKKNAMYTRGLLRSPGASSWTCRIDRAAARSGFATGHLRDPCSDPRRQPRTDLGTFLGMVAERNDAGKSSRDRHRCSGNQRRRTGASPRLFFSPGDQAIAKDRPRHGRQSIGGGVLESNPQR